MSESKSVPDRPRVGVGVLVIKEGKVLLGKRKNAHGKGLYSPPGGNLEFKETIEACAIRELKEETGLKCTSFKVGPWTEDVMDNENHYISFFVVVTGFTGEPQLLEEHKCESWNWYSLDELPTPLFHPLKTLIKSLGIEGIKDLINKCI